MNGLHGALSKSVLRQKFQLENSDEAYSLRGLLTLSYETWL